MIVRSKQSDIEGAFKIAMQTGALYCGKSAYRIMNELPYNQDMEAFAKFIEDNDIELILVEALEPSAVVACKNTIPAI